MAGSIIEGLELIRLVGERYSDRMLIFESLSVIHNVGQRGGDSDE